MGRVWFYSYKNWLPGFWHYFWPYSGSDEYGRRTLVFHVPPIGFVCVAYKTCKCSECDETRTRTARWANELRELQKNG